MHRNLIVVAIVAVPVLVSVHIQAQDHITDRKADEQDIYALVIRSQMEQWIRDGDKNEAEAKSASDKAIAKKLNFAVFFVSIDGEDPSDEFMKTLQ